MLHDVWLAIDEGRFGQAEALLRGDPQTLGGRAGQMALGYLFAQTGRHDEARGIFQSLRDAHRNDPWEHIPLHQLARVERLAGEHETALTLLAEEFALVDALDDHSHELAVNAVQRAVCLRALGRLDEARAALDDSERHATDDPETLGRAQRERGELSLSAGHIPTARLHFERAIAAFREAEDDFEVKATENRLASL